MPPARKNDPPTLTPARLRRWPLPLPESGGKDERGRVLVVGGAAEMPGAIILAATAALRAGAGKLQIATAASVRAHVGAAVPEASVLALPETRDGAIAPGAARLIAERAHHVDALLIGPGMIGDVPALLRALAPRLPPTPLLLDAEAMMFLADDPTALHRLRGKLVLTPHAGEFATLRKIEKSDVETDPHPLAQDAARELRCVLALKGPATFIAGSDGESYVNRAGSCALATSGSGDTLAGLIGGLLARGCDPVAATAWGVYLHARAGEQLARRHGPVGVLARELAVEIPALMRRLSR